MRKLYFREVTRLPALFLVLAIGLPAGPAFALRPQERVEAHPDEIAAGMEEALTSLPQRFVEAWNTLPGSTAIDHVTVDNLRALKQRYDQAPREERIQIEETFWSAYQAAALELTRQRLASSSPIPAEPVPSQGTDVFVPMFIGYLDFSVPFKKEGDFLAVDPGRPNITPASAQTNILRALNLLGTSFQTVGTIGNGPRGSVYLDLLQHEGVTIQQDNWMKISGEDTGFNFYHLFAAEEIEDRFIAPAPAWTDHEEAEYLQRVDQATEKMAGGIFALSMRPPFNKPELMAKLLKIAKKNRMFRIYDPKPDVVGNSDLIESILQEGLDLFKPNLQELAILLRMDEVALRKNPESIVRESRELMKRFNIRMMLVSLDQDGALLIDQNRVAFARPPRIEVASSVGAGDSAIAAFIDRYVRRGFSFDALTDGQFQELLQIFVAAGTETSRQPGTELAAASGIQAMEPRVQSFVQSAGMEEQQGKMKAVRRVIRLYQDAAHINQGTRVLKLVAAEIPWPDLGDILKLLSTKSADIPLARLKLQEAQRQLSEMSLPSHLREMHSGTGLAILKNHFESDKKTLKAQIDYALQLLSSPAAGAEEGMPKVALPGLDRFLGDRRVVTADFLRLLGDLAIDLEKVLPQGVAAEWKEAGYEKALLVSKESSLLPGGFVGSKILKIFVQREREDLEEILRRNLRPGEGSWVRLVESIEDADLVVGDSDFREKFESRLDLLALK